MNPSISDNTLLFQNLRKGLAHAATPVSSEATKKHDSEAAIVGHETIHGSGAAVAPIPIENSSSEVEAPPPKQFSCCAHGRFQCRKFMELKNSSMDNEKVRILIPRC